MIKLRAFIFDEVKHVGIMQLWSIFFFFLQFSHFTLFGFTCTVCFEIHITMTSLCWLYSYVILICHTCQISSGLYLVKLIFMVSQLFCNRNPFASGAQVHHTYLSSSQLNLNTTRMPFSQRPTSHLLIES